MLKWDLAVCVIFNCLGTLCWLAVPCIAISLDQGRLRNFRSGMTDADWMVVASVFVAGLGCYAIGSIIRCLAHIHAELLQQRISKVARPPGPCPIPPERPDATPETSQPS